MSTMAASFRLGTLFLLLVCLAIMGTAAGTKLRLLSFQRTESADKTSYNFTAKFKADKKPTADWVGEITGSSLIYDESSKTGMTCVTLSKTSSKRLTLELGDKGSQYFSLLIKTKGDGNLDHAIDLLSSSVEPSTDLSYSAGSPATLTINITKNRANGVILHTTSVVFMSAYSLNSTDDTVKRVSNQKYKEFFKVEATEKNGIGINKLTVNTDKEIFNGFLYGISGTFTLTKTSPLEAFFEYFVLSIHEDKYTGPFPDDRVFATWGEDKKGCVVGTSDPKSCQFECAGFGNNLHSMEILKVDANNGTSTLIPKRTEVMDTSYHWLTTFTLNTTEHFEGTYVCQVSGDEGTIVAETQQKIVKVEKAPKIQAFTNKTLADGKTELTCTAEGSGPLTVQLMKYRDPLQQGKDGVVSYSPGGPSAEGSDDTVTAVAVVQAGRSYNCVAINWAKRVNLYKRY